MKQVNNLSVSGANNGISVLKFSNLKMNSQVLHFISYRKVLIVVCVFIGLIVHLTSGAQNRRYDFTPDSSKYSWERFSVHAGGFVTGMNSDIQLGSQQVGLGVVVNLEDALGLQSSGTVFRSEMRYNYGKRRRHTLGLEYFGLLRNAQKVLDSDVEIGDQIFPIGTEVKSKFNLQIIKASYSYSFYKDERVMIDASFGLFVMPISFSVKALDLNEVASDFVAPLPVVGIRSNFAITPKLHLKQSVDFLYMKIANFRGVVSDINVTLEYNLWEHFGVGGGLNAYQLNIEAFGDDNNYFDFKGSIKTGYTGLLLYVKYYI